MNAEGHTRGTRRYIALDIHKHYCVVAGVDRDGRVMLHPQRVEHADLEGWLKKNLFANDHVVIESTTNAWHVYDLLEPLAERVVVANPIQVKQIANARVKTDIRDTLILARLLAANLVPEVWVPPQHVRQLRQLLSQRRQLVETHTQIVNRMHSVAHRHHLSHARGKRFNEKTTLWQKDKRLSSVEQFQLELVWYVLTRRQPYRHFSQERIAYKYLTWAWQMDDEARDGLTRQQFARYYLMRLGSGHDLTRIALNPKYPRKLASEAELLALRPELNHIE